MRLSVLGIHWLRVERYEAGEGSGVPRSHRNAECRVLSEAEALAFAVDPQLQLDEQWIREAFARGDACLGALEGGRLVGYAWLAFCDAPHAPGVWLQVGAGVRHVHAAFVRPGYRARRILQALHAHADRPALWRGRRASVSLVPAGEEALRPGSRTLGFAAYVRVFGMLLAWHSPRVRAAGLRFHASRASRIADTMHAWSDQTPHSSA